MFKKETDNTKYNHKEAFCLMFYRCKKCGELERLWNSRDFVTPFIIPCQKCDGHMEHVSWSLDDRQPDYTPRNGQRIFVEMTADTAKELAIKNIEKWKGTEHYPDTTEKYDNLLGSLLQKFMEYPHVVVFKAKNLEDEQPRNRRSRSKYARRRRH